MTAPSRTPYNTGKVKIGLAYERPVRPVLSDDEHRIQDTLLGLHDNTQDKRIKRIVGIVVFILLTSMVVAYAPR
jgi:hypothetical protein